MFTADHHAHQKNMQHDTLLQYSPFFVCSNLSSTGVTQSEADSGQFMHRKHGSSYVLLQQSIK